MDKKKSEFDKVFSAWDILVIAFGAMIGWGWVVSVSYTHLTLPTT